MIAQAQVRHETTRRPCYRVYWLRGDGWIDGAEIIRTEDGGKTITMARGMTDGRSVEVWDRGRFIGRLNHHIG
ncbi:hypothetical protein ACLBXJ_22320 [Methylobacterium mesophilicum]